MLEIDDQEMRYREYVPVVSGAYSIVHRHVQGRTLWCAFDHVLGVDDVEVSAADSNVVVERLWRK